MNKKVINVLKYIWGALVLIIWTRFEIEAWEYITLYGLDTDMLMSIFVMIHMELAFLVVFVPSLMRTMQTMFWKEEQPVPDVKVTWLEADK